MLNYKLVGILLLTLILPAYAMTYGSLTTCKASGDTYCTINDSSTVSGDYSLNIIGINFTSGVTTVTAGRLSINAYGRGSYILFNGGILNSSGNNGQAYKAGSYCVAVGGDGGTGGSQVENINPGVIQYNGATNGTNGNGQVTKVGKGSGLLPFIIPAQGYGNTLFSSGYYSSGGVAATEDISGQVGCAASGGSPYSVEFNGETVNITSGSIFNNAGNSAVYGSGARVGGSGGGEIVVNAIYEYINYSVIQGYGANGMSSFGYSAGGGNSSIMYNCYVLSNTSTGSAGSSFIGGIAIGSGTNGSSQNVVFTNNASCYLYPVSSYIDVISPQPVVYQVGQLLNTQIQYLTSYSNCSVFLNNVTIATHIGIYPNEVISDTLSNISVGSNTLSVSCFNENYSIPSIPDTQMVQFSVSNTQEQSSAFYKAFGILLSSSSCSATIQNTLFATCNEAYNISSPYLFAAVVCPNLNLSLNYGCLSTYNVANITKVNNQPYNSTTNYTIFFYPNTWTYPLQGGTPASNEQIIGAMFYFSSAPLDTGMELYEPNAFVYIPAQNRSKDCDVYFSSTTYCAYYGGFTLNDKSVFISDRTNNWFVANGQGIVLFSTNYSNTTIPVNVLSTASTGTQLFPNGIYTRLNCFVQDGSSYVTDISNTNIRAYSITVTYNNSGVLSYYSFNTTSQVFYQNISLFNSITNGTMSSVIVKDNQGTICSWDGKSRIFLPFSIPAINLGVFSILVYVFLLFTIIVGCFIPYALLVAIILNDTYTIIPTPDMSIIFAFAAIAGLTINAFSFDRGIKHLFIVLGIGSAYLASIQSNIPSSLGVDLSPLTGILTSSSDLITCSGTTNCLWQFVSGAPAYIIQLFIYVLELPFNVITVLGHLIFAISPVLTTGLNPFLTMIAYAGTIYFYLKAYEVLANKFRSI